MLMVLCGSAVAAGLLLAYPGSATDVAGIALFGLVILAHSARRTRLGKTGG